MLMERQSHNCKVLKSTSMFLLICSYANQRSLRASKISEDLLCKNLKPLLGWSEEILPGHNKMPSVQETADCKDRAASYSWTSCTLREDGVSLSRDMALSKLGWATDATSEKSCQTISSGTYSVCGRYSQGIRESESSEKFLKWSFSQESQKL